MTFPRPDVPEIETRAWLRDDERAILDAHVCPDLNASLSVSVSLPEFRDEYGRVKKGSNRKPRTPEQAEREAKAGALIDHYSAGAFNVARLLARLAAARRDANYARLGQEPPR